MTRGTPTPTATIWATMNAGADAGLRNKKRERAESLARAAGHEEITTILKQHKSGIRWPFD